ncbi:carotenoid cleavage dioxygenase [Tamaricihabitans halophyticus]|uniref:Dioxygenase n=1 Tax=Tamaricihabitans halophyticus TaxID=1262583 RepID=A0A4R2R078_9PSEU|nr:carotenoid oxygenase family protein [Tamaricihabitans halophyticus]TCP54939.1 carotenoid cleavage dioxygenase [Tamaricihabitans halophyticus]
MTADNPYLHGHFAPVHDETTAYDLPVVGRIPSELDGRYLRIGPNPLGIDDPATHIWAAAEGMVHGVRIRDGKAEWYRNRWVRSSSVLDALGEPRRANSLDPARDFAPNVHVIGHAGKTFALVEAGACPYELDHELGTVGPSDLGATPDGFVANAHAKLDHATGELHSLAYIPGLAFAQHIVSDVNGELCHVTTIPTAADTPYMHDFALTESHVIVYDTPLVYRAELLAQGITPGATLGWKTEHPGRVGVLSRSGGPVRWFETAPTHISHTLNAYDEGNRIIVDVIRSDEPVDPVDPGAVSPILDRWEIDLAAGKVTSAPIDERPQDFPRLNESFVARRHRYGYSAASELYGLPFPVGDESPAEASTNALVKHDLEQGTVEVHRFPRGVAVGEAAFAANPYGHAEDDGYLMTYINDPERGASDLLILAAQDFSGTPVARIQLPVRVPLGLHGSWIPDS